MHLAGEGDIRADRVAAFLDVLLDRQLPAHGFDATSNHGGVGWEQCGIGGVDRCARRNDVDRVDLVRSREDRGCRFDASAVIRAAPPDMTSSTPKLLDQVKGRMRARHMSPRTVQAYVSWIVRHIRYHGVRHPSELGEPEIVAYLTYLAAERQVSRSTQMQALSAIQLLYREVLGRDISDVRRVLRSASPTRLPAVLSRDEVRALLAALAGSMHLIALLLYGAGLRLMECLTLRVKDFDFTRGGNPRAPRQGREGQGDDASQYCAGGAHAAGGAGAASSRARHA